MRDRAFTWAAAAALLWLNLYFCRQAFFIESSAYSNSMHGFWMALARVPFREWLVPTWFPWWDGGMPLEYTYAPLIPWLMRGVAMAGAIPVSHAFHIVAAAVFCLGPVTLFWSCRRLSGSVALSFLAAAVYSLTAPTELIAPDAQFAWIHFADARRMYLAFVWDEAPHLAALALFPLALWSWVRLVERPSGGMWLRAVLATAATVLASAFGVTLLAMALVCLLAARPAAEWRVIAVRLSGAALAAYLLISPWMPPSLIETIRRNSNTYPEGVWTADSAKALLLVGAGWAAAAWLLRRATRDWFLRFWVQLACVLAGIVALHGRLGWHFLPQSGRYKVEMEMAFAAALVFALGAATRRWPAALKLAMVAALVPLAARQVIAHRRYAKVVVRSAPAESMFEYQMARTLRKLSPGARVFAPGSLAMWLNHFAPELPQFSGGSFPTAINPVQQAAVQSIYLGDRAAEWLKAFGAGTFVVAGRDSGEFWKPFRDPAAFETQFPLLWRAAGTSVYRVAPAQPSLAHVVPPDALTSLDRYAAALDDPAGPAATAVWRGSNRLTVAADIPPGRVVSLQINHHPGWRADVPVRRDALGLMALRPARAGPQTFDLRYTGGWEAWLTRAAALAALLAGAVILARRR